jgi:hypothetical protein
MMTMGVNPILRKTFLGAAVAMIAIIGAACKPKSLTCTVQLSTPDAVTRMAGLGSSGLSATEFPSLEAQAKVSADQQGYAAVNVIVAGIPVPSVARSIQQGESSNSVFVRASVANATIVSKQGTAVLSMTKSDGTPVGSATFPYHRSGNQIRFDDPATVDQWILAYQAGLANYLSVGIPDLLLDTGTTSREVSVEVGADYQDVEIITDRESWYSAKKNCARCLIP